MRLQLNNLPGAQGNGYVSNEREYFKLMQKDHQLPCTPRVLSARSQYNANDLIKLQEPEAVTRSHQVLNPAPALQTHTSNFVLPQYSFCSPKRKANFQVKRHSYGGEPANQMFFRSSTPLDDYFTGQPMCSHRSNGANEIMSPYGGGSRPSQQPQQMRNIAKMSKRQKWHGVESQAQKAHRTSEESALLSEIIGLRKSKQNIDYLQVCFNCNNDRNQFNMQQCPECKKLPERNGHSQYLQQKQQQLAPSQSQPSLNSCTLSRISPIAERHFSPRNGENVIGISNCADVVKVAQQRANEARRSHRRFDVRTYYNDQQSHQKHHQPWGGPSSPRRAFNTPQIHGHGIQSLPLLSQTNQKLHQSSSTFLRRQPSQNSSQKRSPIPKGRQVNVQAPTNYVIVDNNRHQSCAIQQPCNYCDNPDCFSPANGIETCCMQLLQEQQQQQNVQMQQQNQDLHRLEMRQQAMDFFEAELGGIEEHTEEDPLSTIDHQSGREQDRELDTSIIVEPIETVVILKNGVLIMEPAPLQRETTVSSGRFNASGQQKISKEEHPLPNTTVQSTQTFQTAKKKKKKKKPVGVGAEVQTAIESKPELVSQSAQASPDEPISQGNEELQRLLAMINRLCVYYLSKASRSQLEKRRAFFEGAQVIMEEVRNDLEEVAPIYNNNSDSPNQANLIDSRFHEAEILARVKSRCEELLRKNAPLSLLQNFQLQSNLQGNLVLIVYLLDNSLKLIFEKMIVELRSAQDIAFCDLSKNDSQSRILYHNESFEARPDSPILVFEFSMAEEIALDTSALTDEVFRDNQVSHNRSRSRRADMSGFDREKFYQRLGINFDENEQKTEAVEVDSPAQIVEEQKEEEETEQEETKRKQCRDYEVRPQRDCSVEQTVQLSIIAPQSTKAAPPSIHQTQQTQTAPPSIKDAANQSVSIEPAKIETSSIEVQTAQDDARTINVEKGIQVDKQVVEPKVKQRAMMATQETQTIINSPVVVQKVESPPKKIIQPATRSPVKWTTQESQKVVVPPKKVREQRAVQQVKSMELEELIEVQSEFSSMGLADAEEITIEKSIDVSRSKRRRADLSSFDLDAFYRRQGAYDESDSYRAPVLLEQQMATEEYELELADPSPIQIERQVELTQKQRLPDLVDRDAFFKRIGLEVSDKKSEAPTEKKAQQYSLPIVEPMNFSWTYQAMRFEEQKSIESDQELVDYEDLVEVEVVSSEAENINDSDQEEGITARLNVHASSIENKLKLNDYVFDEGQNLQEELLKIELRQMVGRDSTQLSSLNNLMNKQQLYEWENDRVSCMKEDTVSPRHEVRYPFGIAESEQQKKSSRHAQYLNEDEANALQHAVKFVSPVSLGGERESMNEHKFMKRYVSPPGGHLPLPANEDSKPNMPYRSSKLKRPSQEVFILSNKENDQKHQTRNIHFNVTPISKQTPQGSNQLSSQIFAFPMDSAHAEESAPTTKIDCNFGHHLSERLNYNHDPLSYNRNSIEIDDDGNINIGSSPSRSPSPMRTIRPGEERLDDAKTFQSSHFIFSHLMSFDAQKHTLSQLNKSTRANLVQKGLQSQARDFAGASTFGASRYGSPSFYSRSGRGSAQVGPGPGPSPAVRGGLSNLSRILAGGKGGAGRAQSPSFLSGIDGNSQYTQSVFGGQGQQPHLIVKQASKIKVASPSDHSQVRGSQDVLKEISSSLKPCTRSSSPGVKQHTFYPGQFQQVIPEQINEETHRKMTTTAKFNRDEIREETKQNRNSASVQNFLFSEQTEQNNQIQEYPNSMPRENEDNNRRSSMSQGNFSKYFMGAGGSNNNNNSFKAAAGGNVFAKYFVQNSAESGTDHVISAREFDQLQQPPDAIIQSTETAGNALTFRSSNMNVMFASPNMVVGSSHQEPNRQGGIQTFQTSSQNQNASMEKVQIHHAPIRISQLLADQSRPTTQAMHRGTGVISRQTVDPMRSELGGRSSVQDSTSVMMKRRTLEMKGPQASDIMPIFKMQKAQPNFNQVRPTIRSTSKKSQHSRNDYNLEDKRNIRLWHDRPFDGRSTVQGERQQQQQMQRPASQQVVGINGGRGGLNNSLIKIADF